MEDVLKKIVSEMDGGNLSFHQYDALPNFHFLFMHGISHTWAEVKLIHCDDEGIETYCIFGYSVVGGLDTLMVIDEGTIPDGLLEGELLMMKLRGNDD